MKNIIENKLACLNPIYLEIMDETYKHFGHLEKQELETHFKLKIISDIFINLPKIERHKIIYRLLKDELESKIHALSIQALTLQESDL